jgi:hypothetical protein
MRVASDGTVQNYLTIFGTNPQAGRESQDECWGVTPKEDGSFAAVLSIKMTEVRDNSKGDFKDIILILFTSAGTVKRATTFTLGNIRQSMHLTGNALIIHEDQYLFAGFSVGYQTRLQKLVYTKDSKTGGLTTTTKTDYDGFVFRHIFDRSLGYCALSFDVGTTTIQRKIVSFNGFSAQQEGLAVLKSRDQDVKKTRLAQDAHVPYASRYSGGFALLDSFKIPRPCAYKSYNMT